MRTNAIIRIIIWSLVIVLLSGILCSILFGFTRRTKVVEATLTEVHITSPTMEVPITSPTMEGESAVVTDEVNVRSMPSEEAVAIAVLKTGVLVQINRQETVNGKKWAFITEPEQGWVLMEYVDTNALVQVSADPGAEISLDADQVQNIEIEWVAGSILIQPIDTDQILFSEDGVSDSKYTMVWKHRGDTLSISFCEESIMDFGFGISVNTELSKDLTIYVPMDWVCDSLEIEAASASVEINDLTIRDVEFDGASGTCEFENCKVDKIDLDTASGDIRFIGSLSILDCDAASANIYAVLDNVPTRMDMDSMSGDLDITLPENAGFTLSMDGLNMDFSSDFETTMKNNNHVCGDGSCRINVDAMSGDVAIRKGSPSAVDTIVCTDENCTEPSHHHEERHHN